MTYANLSDVQTRLGRTVSDASEVAQINAWLSDAETVITGRISNLVALVTAGTIPLATVVMVECRAVIRKINNPDGKQNERLDDYSFGLNPDQAKGEIFLTDEEWEMVTPDTGSAEAFTIRPRGMRDLYGEWSPPAYSEES